jgi:cell division protein FtsN
METLVYVNLAPDNGGLVLNVSPEGFGFQVVSPMLQVRTIRFWCSPPGNRLIEAVGELAWTDATRKTGGLRLTSAPAEVREQILNLVGQPALSPSTDEALEAQSQSVLGAVVGTWPQLEIDAALESETFVPQKTRLPETRVLAPLKLTPSPLIAAQRVEKKISTDSRAHARPRFLRRAVFGILILVVPVAALLLNSYRRQVGVSLMQLGARFAGTPLPQSGLPVPVRDSKSNPSPESLNLTTEELGKKLQTQIDETNRPSDSDTEEPQAPAVAQLQERATPLRVRVPKPSQAATETTTPSIPSSPMPTSTTSSLSRTPPSEGAAPSWFESTDPVQSSPASAGDLDVESASLTTYFEVGNFKDSSWAAKAIETLTQSGFQAVVVRKERLWMNSYHVLVGPFGTDAAAESARRDLQSLGFKPRSTRIIPSKSQ